MVSFNNWNSPAQGRSGGLLCIWNSDVFVVDEVLPGVGYFGVAGFWKGCPMKVTMLNICGPQEAMAKRLLWSNLLRLQDVNDFPWCLMGDFNVVRETGE